MMSGNFLLLIFAIKVFIFDAGRKTLSISFNKKFSSERLKGIRGIGLTTPSLGKATL
jgi:hypothetical protein